MQSISVVEYFKKGFVKVASSLANLDNRGKANIAIDLFVVLKWLLLIFVWWKGYNNVFMIVITFYMIVTNLHTYFYYHVWTTPSNLTTQEAASRAKRRLVSLLMAVAYSNTCFAYLYAVCFSSDISWGKGINPTIAALQLSWGNGLAGSFGSSSPATSHGAVVIACQQVMTFVFIAIILSKTIPSDE